MDWLCTEEFVEVEHKSRSNLVVGHSWDPYLVRIASSLGRSSEKCTSYVATPVYLNHVTMSYADYICCSSKLSSHLGAVPSIYYDSYCKKRHL